MVTPTRHAKVRVPSASPKNYSSLPVAACYYIEFCEQTCATLGLHHHEHMEWWPWDI